MSDRGSLPPRVIQTLEALLTGRSVKEIAFELGLSANTVRTYVRMLHRHYNVSTQGELLAKFIAKSSNERQFASAGEL